MESFFQNVNSRHDKRTKAVDQYLEIVFLMLFLLEAQLVVIPLFKKKTQKSTSSR